MVFYLNSISGKENIQNLNLSFKRKFTKIDKCFMKLLIKEYEEKKEIFINLNKLNLMSLINLKNDEDILNYLDKFMKTGIYYEFSGKENYLSRASFHIIDSFFIEKDAVIVVLSKEVLMAFEKDKNFFSRINLRAFFEFENTNTYPIYLKLLNNNSNQEELSLDFPLEEFKTLLDICDCYERFYDIEKKIIEPIINDLNKYSDYTVRFEKLKKSPSASSKISGIRFSFSNKKIKELKAQTNNLLSLIKAKINNFDLMYTTIYESIEEHGYNYVLNNINYVNQKKDIKNFENLLINAFEENPCQKGNTHNENHIIIEKQLASPYELHQELYKTLQKIGLEHKAENHLFLGAYINKIYQLRDGESYGFSIEGIKINIFYKKNGKSLIEILVE